MASRNVVGVGLIAAGLVVASRLPRRVDLADLRGQVALVTGGSRGLGFLLARELGRQGCRVAICARDPAELEAARLDLERRGIEVAALPCDVADRNQVERLVRDARDRFGQIDILVNNAGIIQVAPLQDTALKDFEDAMDVMYWGVVYPTLAILPEMRERHGGRIINVTSIGGKLSVPHLLPYSSAKFAAVGFSEGLRAELSGTGVELTTIVPGLLRTGSYLRARFGGQQEKEFAWFSLGSSLPLISMDAERAARQIVRAARCGEAERILSVPAALGARVQGLAPGLTAELAGIAGRLIMPAPDGAGMTLAEGWTVQARERARLLRVLTKLGRRAAARFHQIPSGAAGA